MAKKAEYEHVMSETDGDDHHDFPMERISDYMCDDKWAFSKRDRSQEVYLSNSYRTAHFHPNWSKGTAGIRGTRILNNGRYFWELKVSQRVFGTR